MSTPISARLSAGEGRAGDRIVFLHGFIGSPEVWDPVIKYLLAGTKILRETILGHSTGKLTGAGTSSSGRIETLSDLVPPFDASQADSGLAAAELGTGPEVRDGSAAPFSTFESEVDRLAARIRAWTSGPVHIVGYSLGARLALGLLIRHGNLFLQVTLIGVNPGIEDPESRVERRAADERWARLLENEGMAAFLAAWESQDIFATQRSLPADLRAAEMSRRQKQDPRGLALALRRLGLAQMPNYWPSLPNLQLPITLLVGALDPRFHAVAQRMATLLPHARLDLVPEAGHNIVLEKPEAVAAAVGRSNKG